MMLLSVTPPDDSSFADPPPTQPGPTRSRAASHTRASRRAGSRLPEVSGTLDASATKWTRRGLCQPALLRVNRRATGRPTRIGADLKVPVSGSRSRSVPVRRRAISPARPPLPSLPAQSARADGVTPNSRSSDSSSRRELSSCSSSEPALATPRFSIAASSASSQAITAAIWWTPTRSRSTTCGACISSAAISSARGCRNRGELAPCLRACMLPGCDACSVLEWPWRFTPVPRWCQNGAISSDRAGRWEARDSADLRG